MTPGQKAAATRKRHQEARARKALDQKRIAEAIVKAMLSVLADESATAAEKLEAAKLLDEVRQR